MALQLMLFERSGKECFEATDINGATPGDLEGMAKELGGPVGLLRSGRAFIGPLAAAVTAFAGEGAPTVDLGDEAWFVYQEPDSGPLDQNLPAGTWKASQLRSEHLLDGRPVWWITGTYLASQPGAC